MAALPYYAPTYFSPSYFYAPSVPMPATGPSPYYAPTYFPPTYFYGGAAPEVVVPVPPEPQGRDQRAYAAMLVLLRATGKFEEVVFGDATQRSRAGAGRYPLAVVTPRGWEEADECDPSLILRRVSFGIKVLVRIEVEGSQFDLLDHLAAVIQAAVDRSSLDGTCLPPLTRIRAGRYDYATHFPEQCVELEGEFASIIDPLTNLIVSS